MAILQARSSSARVYPAGRAVAVFAVCGPELAGRRLTVEGRRILAVPFDRFALLLSYVDRKAYSPSELERRATDAPWQVSEARVHERVVERASVHGGVLPLRALTIVADTNELEAFVNENAVRWSRSLARLGGRRECAVHVFVGPHAAIRGDEPYSLRVARHVTRSARLPLLEGPAAVTEHARGIWQACTSIAQATRRIAPGERRGSLWSAVLLLCEDDVKLVVRALERASSGGVALGVTTYLEGPRAPFSFA